MTIDVALASYAAAVVVAYYLGLFLVGRRGMPMPDRPSRWPVVVIVIPARNEAAVIERTVTIALQRPYPGEVRVLVMNDASIDATAEIAVRLSARDRRVRSCHRDQQVGGRGKSDVLNHAYREIRALVRAGDPWLGGGVAEQDVCLCVLDADGQLSATALTDATALLAGSGVGAVQVGVKIRNASDNVLARLQDLEFVGFSFMVQAARDRLGSVGLGGNGQFARLEALIELGDSPWHTAALTEDLDLGLRLQLRGWRLRFCRSAWVAQEGLTKVRPLLRQRTRWTQGHYQCWRYLPHFAAGGPMRARQRFDTIAYLVLILLVVLVTATAVVHVLSAVGMVSSTDSFLAFMGDDFGYRAATFLLSWLPVLLLVATYQRFADIPLRTWEIPAYCVFFGGFVYLWAIATARAWTRLVLGRGGWTKTPRVGSEPGLVVVAREASAS